MLDEWIAFRRIQGDPLDRIAIILKRGFILVASAWGAKLGEDTYKALDPQSSLDPREEEYTSPEQMVSILSSVLGKPHGHSNR